MAHVNIHDYVGIGLDFSEHVATSYQVAKDKDYKIIVDQSLSDVKNLTSWNTPLKMLPIDGDGYYADLCKLYTRVKLHIGNSVSIWYELPPITQRYQKVVITQRGKDDIVTDSTTLRWDIECGLDPAFTFKVEGLNLRPDENSGLSVDEDYDFVYTRNELPDYVFSDRDMFTPDGIWVPKEEDKEEKPEEPEDMTELPPDSGGLGENIDVDVVWEDDLGQLYVGTEKAYVRFIDISREYPKDEYVQ